MSETVYFLSGFSACALVTLSIIAIIHKKLFALLTDLCQGETRARFWTVAVEIWFFLYSISSALRWCPEVSPDKKLFFATIQQVKNGLNGMSTAVIIFSFVLLAFIFIRTLTRENNKLRREDT